MVGQGGLNPTAATSVLMVILSRKLCLSAVYDKDDKTEREGDQSFPLKAGHSLTG